MYKRQYRITDITLPDGNTLRYEYDEEGNLISVTNPEGDIRRYEDVYKRQS